MGASKAVQRGMPEPVANNLLDSVVEGMDWYLKNRPNDFVAAVSSATAGAICAYSGIRSPAFVAGALMVAWIDGEKLDPAVSSDLLSKWAGMVREISDQMRPNAGRLTLAEIEDLLKTEDGDA